MSTQNTTAAQNNWPKEVNYDSLAGWSLEKEMRLQELKDSFISKGLPKINKDQAKTDVFNIIRQLDTLYLKHMLTDIHTADYTYNEDKAFRLLDQALQAFKDLENKI